MMITFIAVLFMSVCVFARDVEFYHLEVFHRSLKKMDVGKFVINWNQKEFSIKGKIGPISFFNDKYWAQNGPVEDCIHGFPITEVLKVSRSIERLFEGAEQIRDLTFDKEVNSCKEAYSIRYLGDILVGCFENNKLDRIIAEDYIIRVKKDKEDPEFDIPIETLKHCPDSKIPFGMVNLEPWFMNSKTCHLHWIREDSVCSGSHPNLVKGELMKRNHLIAPQEDCLFLHGAGNFEEGPPVSDWPEYWGQVSDYTPQCKTRLFIRTNTKLFGWNDDNLQDMYCKFAANGTTVTINGKEIPSVKGKSIFLHSMGNLILGESIRRGRCHFDSSTKWYDIQGPLSGSKAADFVVDICKGEGGYSDKLYQFIASKGGYCLPNEAKAYPVYNSLSPSNPRFEGLKEFVSKMVYRSMCGDSSFGILSTDSVLWALSKVVNYGEENDGMVPLSQSCIVGPESEYSRDWNDRYYIVDANHSDGRCYSGNGFTAGKKPCSFYLPQDY